MVHIMGHIFLTDYVTVDASAVVCAALTDEDTLSFGSKACRCRGRWGGRGRSKSTAVLTHGSDGRMEYRLHFVQISRRRRGVFLQYSVVGAKSAGCCLEGQKADCSHGLFRESSCRHAYCFPIAVLLGQTEVASLAVRINELLLYTKHHWLPFWLPFSRATFNFSQWCFHHMAAVECNFFSSVCSTSFLWALDGSHFN